MNKLVTEKTYKEVSERYNVLSSNLELSLQVLLNEENISYHGIHVRIKTYESLTEKIERKGYVNVDDIEDFCGVRIICYYLDDVERIKKIISREFLIVNTSDKENDSLPDQFWYRSFHFVVKLKDYWLSVPNFKGFKDYKIEIQIRTILMHAWADIEHQLSYKKPESVPRQLKRSLAQISAVLCLADESFNKVKNEKNEYIEMVKKDLSTKELQMNVMLDFDSLQTFLDLHFSSYKKAPSIEINRLLKQLLEKKISFNDIITGYQKISNYEEEILKDIRTIFSKDSHIFLQTGIIRLTLDLTNESFFRRHLLIPKSILPQGLLDMFKKWQIKVNGKEFNLGSKN